MFIHSVYFWLKPELTPEQLTDFERGLQFLRTIETVHAAYIGIPAASDRPVVDAGYTYALVFDLGDQQGHDAYQEHPIHLAFVEKFKPYWTQIKVYDVI